MIPIEKLNELPEEIKSYIFEYDPLYKCVFYRKVIQELKEKIFQNFDVKNPYTSYPRFCWTEEEISYWKNFGAYPHYEFLNLRRLVEKNELVYEYD